jgi:hypothetical protein
MFNRPSDDAKFDAEATMRTTVTLSEELLAKASELTRRDETSILVRTAGATWRD